MWYSVYRHNLIYDRSFLLSWTQVACALRPVYTVENRIRIQQETRVHMNVDSAGALIDQGWGQSCFQKENCICAATIRVQYIQFIVIYQSVCTHETLQLFFFFFFKLQIDPNSDCRWLKLLNHNRTQCYQVVYIFFFFLSLHVLLYMHKQCMYVVYLCIRFTSSSMSCNSLIALRPQVEWHSLSKESGRRASFSFIHKSIKTLIFVHRRASGTENKWSALALPLSRSLYPFPISLSHTHTCTCTHSLIPHPFPCLSSSLSQRKNGRYILMEKWWPWLIILSLKNGSSTFSASMCLLVDGPGLSRSAWSQWNPLCITFFLYGRAYSNS